MEHPPFYVAARGLARLPLNGVPAAKLRAGHARPLRSTRGSDLPLPGVFSGATGGHGAVKTAPYKPPAIAASQGGMTDWRKRCAHPLAPSARGLRPQAVGERTVRLPEIFRAMARFSPSAPSGHLPRRGRFFDSLRFFCASHKKIPHRPEQRTMGAKRNKQTAKKAQSKTPKRRRSLLLAGTAPVRQ